MSNAKRTVLLVDDDPQVAQQVRLALHGPACHVVVAGDPQRTWREKPQLVLVEQETGLKAVPMFVNQGCAVVVLATEDSIVGHVRAIQLGAWDYVHKPLDESGLDRLTGEMFQRLETGERPAAVKGPCVGQLMTRLQQIERDAVTGVLTLQRQASTAYILFSFGEVQQAEHAGLKGHLALNAIAAIGDWTLSFKEDKEDTDVPTGRVNRSLQPAWRSIATRVVFYGPPSTPGVVEDPHDLVTRRAHLPPGEMLKTIVDARPAGLEARPTEEVSPEQADEILRSLDAVTTEEFFQEENTTEPGAHIPTGPYEEIRLVYTDDEVDETSEHDPDGVKPPRR